VSAHILTRLVSPVGPPRHERGCFGKGKRSNGLNLFPAFDARPYRPSVGPV